MFRVCISASLLSTPKYTFQLFLLLARSKLADRRREFRKTFVSIVDVAISPLYRCRNCFLLIYYVYYIVPLYLGKKTPWIVLETCVILCNFRDLLEVHRTHLLRASHKRCWGSDSIFRGGTSNDWQHKSADAMFEWLSVGSRTEDDDVLLIFVCRRENILWSNNNLSVVRYLPTQIRSWGVCSMCEDRSFWTTVLAFRCDKCSVWSDKKEVRDRFPLAFLLGLERKIFLPSQVPVGYQPGIVCVTTAGATSRGWIPAIEVSFPDVPSGILF